MSKPITEAGDTKAEKITLSDNTGNKDILIEIFKEMHPVAAGRTIENADVKIHATNFLEKVISNKANFQSLNGEFNKVEKDGESNNYVQ